MEVPFSYIPYVLGPINNKFDTKCANVVRLQSSRLHVGTHHQKFTQISSRV